MLKIHDLRTAVINGLAVNYFSIREKNDRNGNPRHRVYIIDPEGPAVHETIFKCYDGQIKDRVKSFIEGAGE